MPSEFKVNQVIDKKYKVLSIIGKGGMGVVVKVEDLKDKNNYAIKYCSSYESGTIKRFAREVRICSSIKHKNVMPILFHNLDFEPPYYVMPLAEYSNSQIIQLLKNKKIDLIDFFIEVCKGLQAIHSNQAIHRDLKPSNILILKNNQVVVSDLGLARLEIRDTTTLTTSLDFLGTVQYAAPEQLTIGGSKSADVRTDIFQIGKTFYEFITGDDPYVMDLDKVPVGLSNIIDKCTKKDPKDRFQDIEELLDSLVDYKRSINPYTSHNEIFNLILKDINEMLLKEREFKASDLKKLINTVISCSDDYQEFLGLFDKIPKPILRILSKKEIEGFEVLLKQYCKILNEHMKEFNFVYAETVSEAMTLVYDNAKNLSIKKLAFNCILIAGIDLNRFVVIDKVKNILTSISDSETAIGLAEVLVNEIKRFSYIIDQLPKSRLHPAFHKVWEKSKKE